MNHSDEKMFGDASAPHINNNEELTSNSDVDILECGSSEPIATVNSDPDATECSSSFSDTYPGANDDPKLEMSDAEVESKLVEPPLYYGDNRLFEKKKLTEHWRRHIQPEIWRCKLLELWIKKLISRADRYDKQIEVYKNDKQRMKEKHWPANKCTSREVPFEFGTKIKVMRRKKRKRPEGIVDILHTVNQILLPYFEKRQGHEDISTDAICNKQADQDIKVHNDDLGINFSWSMLKFKNGDSFLEQILFDIDVAQLRVHELKSQLNNVICNSSIDIFSSPCLFIPGDTEYRQSLSPRCSPVNHGNAAPFEATSTPYASDFENDEKAIPGSADSSFVGASHTDIFESTSTVDLLAMNLTHARYQMRNEVADDILINNQAAEEFHGYEFGHQKQHDTLEEDDNLSDGHEVSSSETETDPEIASVSERRPAMKRARKAAAELHLRRSKRKRKLRRPSPGSWNGEICKKKQLKKQH